MSEGPLVAPKSRRGREGVRAVIEGLLELVPGIGGFLSKFTRVARPPLSEVEAQDWREQATDRINAQGGEIARIVETLDGRPIKLTATEVALVGALSEAMPNGRPRSYVVAELGAAMLPNVDTPEVESAAHHLVALGLLDDDSAIGSLIVRPTQRFFEQLDPHLKGWNTRDDAVTLANLMLQRNEGDSDTLLGLIGWELRRFNPAQRHLMKHLPDGLISKELQPTFATSYISMAPPVTAALRVFIERNG